MINWAQPLYICLAIGNQINYIKCATYTYIADQKTCFLVSKNWSRCEGVMGLSPSRRGGANSYVIKMISSLYYIYMADMPAIFSVVVMVSWVKVQGWKGEGCGFESQLRRKREMRRHKWKEMGLSPSRGGMRRRWRKFLQLVVSDRPGQTGPLK